MESNKFQLYKEPFTEEAAADFITEAIMKCDKLKDLSDPEALQIVLKSLSSSYFDFKAHREKMCDLLIRKKYLQITNSMLESLEKKGYFSDDDIWFSTYYALNSLWNFCDFSQKLATGILLTDIPKIMIRNILSKSYLASLSEANILYVMKASISIVHNIARFPGNKGTFNTKEIKDTLIILIKERSEEFLGLISMLTLAVLIDETELCLLEEGSNTIHGLIDHIKRAHKSDEKRVEGFMVWELVNCLRCISANDNMKKTILQHGGFEILIDILKTPSNDDDIEKSLSTVWNLCFDDEVTDDEARVEAINLAIKPYEEHRSADIRRLYCGIVWLLGKKSQFIEKTDIVATYSEPICESTLEAKFDIFISYAAEDKTMVWNIKDELLKSNVTVWIDTDALEGSSIESMAEGIENSKAFVMAVSNAYRTSPHCRSEAEYAFALKKPIFPLMLEHQYKPGSWLGFIVGSNPHYVFSEQQLFYDSVRELFNGIVRILNLNNATESHGMPLMLRNIKLLSPVEHWSKFEVENWLKEAELGHVNDKFEGLQGPLLKTLIELSFEAPEFLYQTVKKDYGLSLIDILKLRHAITRLSLN